MIKMIHSRKLIAKKVHENVTDKLAAKLFQRAVLNEKCNKNLLVIHSDNGALMKDKRCDEA
jgi:putative transposase